MGFGRRGRDSGRPERRRLGTLNPTVARFGVEGRSHDGTLAPTMLPPPGGPLFAIPGLPGRRHACILDYSYWAIILWEIARGSFSRVFLTCPCWIRRSPDLWQHVTL
jgi:hypothetical protein